jgi:hypothetical protein
MISVPMVVFVLLVIGATVLATKAGAVALRLTGLDEERAHFQALSAVTGTGFTTRESELVVSDPRRRRIVGALMIFGNVALVTVISLLVGSFTRFESSLEVPIYVFVFFGGGYLLYRVLIAPAVAKRFSGWFGAKLAARLRLQERPVHEVLALAEGYGVAEVAVAADSPRVGKTLAGSGLRQAGLLVLAIRRRGLVVPAPTADVAIEAGDRLVCYGMLERMQDFVRQSGPARSKGPAAGPAAPDVVSLSIPREEPPPADEGEAGK